MKKCPKCGAEIPEGAKFCPACGAEIPADDPKPEDQTPAADDAGKMLKDITAGVSKAVKDAVDPIKQSVDAIDKRVQAIESLPLKSGAKGAGIISKEVYRGYKISDQGDKIRAKFESNPRRFKTLSDMNKFDEFAKFMLDYKAAICGDVKAQMKLQEARAKATDLEESTGATAAYAVPVEYEADLIKLAEEDTFALQNCTVVPMGSNVKKIPAELTRMSVYWPDEAGSITESNPTLAQVTLTAKKLAGLTSEISSELLSDSLFDITGWLTEQFMYAMGLELDNQVLNGTGSPVSGVLTAACGNSVVMGAGSTSFSAVTADVIRSMIRSLSAKDAANAKFVYSKDIQYYIDVLKDSNNRYLYREPAGDRPAALWNRPIFEASNAPLEAASGASTAFIALGDWKKFYIGNRLGTMQFAADPYTNFNTDEIQFRVIRRWALAFGRASAFCRLVTGA